MSNDRPTLGPDVAIDQCLASATVRHSTADRIRPTLESFAGYLLAQGIDELDAITAEVAEGFVQSRLRTGLAASRSTQRNRRAALRRLFAAARQLGLASGDPTLDLELPPLDSVPTRPLTDDEVERCREAARWSSSRAAAAWALAEATARGQEIATVLAGDVDLDNRAVQLKGGPRTSPRTGDLSDWGVNALGRRLEEVATGTVAYTGSGSSNAGQVSTCRAISALLVRAGLAGQPGVRPASVAGWAGRRVFDTTGRIEDAAQVMGVRSLDRAARLIGLDWSEDA